MNELAPIETGGKPTKERRISKRLRHAIDLLTSGEAKTKKAAAEKAGLTRERFSRALKESHVQEYLAAQTRVLLAQAQGRAAAVLLTLMDSARSEHVKKDIAVHVLAINGHRPPDRNGPVFNVGFSVGYVIDLSGPRDAAPHIIDATVSGAADE
ncbi:hypothetical protein ACVWXM_007724 [Bradyrhizobium sp. GM7.3]